MSEEDFLARNCKDGALMSGECGIPGRGVVWKAKMLVRETAQAKLSSFHWCSVSTVYCLSRWFSDHPEFSSLG